MARKKEHGNSCNNGTHELAVDAIFRSLNELMEEKPFSDISITEIVANAGVSRMAYYRNYDSKEEILTSRLEQVLGQLADQLEALDESTVDQRAVLIQAFESIYHTPIFSSIVKAGLLQQLAVTYRNVMMRIYENKFHWDLTDPDLEMRMYFDLGGILGLGFFELKNREGKGPSEIADFLIDVYGRMYYDGQPRK